MIMTAATDVCKAQNQERHVRQSGLAGIAAAAAAAAAMAWGEVGRVLGNAGRREEALAGGGRGASRRGTLYVG